MNGDEAIGISGRQAQLGLKLGTKTKVGLAALAGLVALGVAGNAIATSATSPSAVATEYVRAVGQNNVDQAWQVSKVLPEQPNGQGLDGQILRLDSKEDFVAMMKLPPNRHPARDDIQVTHLSTMGDSTVVSLAFREGGEQRSTSVVLQKSPDKRYLLYPDWRVVVTPSLLTWLPPVADAKILIDGTPASGRAALTLPGYHKLTLVGGALFADSTQDVPEAQSLAQPVRFPLRLTAQANTAAKNAVNAYFTNCAARSSALPSGCPQAAADWTPINVHWTLIGDPSSQMEVDVEANPGSSQASAVPQVVAHGHYLMTVVFDGTGGTKHRFSGGTYALALNWDGSQFAASEAQAFHQPTRPLVRPSVSDDVVKSAVADAFAACARIKAVSGAPNCPMDFASIDVISNPQWELVGDQLQGANLGFDEATGVLTVTGSYKMKLSYSTESSAANSANSEGNYIAYVVWDGKNATAAYIR